MLNLSEVIMQHHELESFQELVEVIKQRALEGELPQRNYGAAVRLVLGY